MSEPSAPSTSKSSPKSYIRVVGLPRSTMMVSDAHVAPSQAVAQVSSDIAGKLPEAIRSWFGIKPDITSLPRIYRELMIDHDSKDQLLWQSDEHLTPEYVLLYDLPGEDDDSCKEIAKFGHGEWARQTVEQMEEERKKAEVGQGKEKQDKKNKRRRNKKAKKEVVDVPGEENRLMDKEIVARLQAELAEHKEEIAKLQREVEKYQEAGTSSRTLAAKYRRRLDIINRRHLLNNARTKLHTTYSKIPELVVHCYEDAEYERQLCNIVSQVLPVLKEEHRFLGDAEIRMIVDGRPGTIRGAGNVAAHSHDTIPDDFSDLTESQKLTLVSIYRFIDKK